MTPSYRRRTAGRHSIWVALCAAALTVQAGLLPAGLADNEGSASALKAEVDRLRAALLMEQARTRELEAQLAGATDSTTPHYAASRASQQPSWSQDGLVGGAAAPAPPAVSRECPKADRPAWTGLPNGSYAETCVDCVRLANSLTCLCYTPDVVDPSGGPLAPRGNVSGLWTNSNSYGMPGGGRIQLRTQALSHNVTGFTLLCLDGGYEMYCNPNVPGKNGTVWRSGRGTAHVPTGQATLYLDNQQVLEGNFDFNFTVANWSTSQGGISWSRVPITGQRTSISLDACKPGSMVRNQNGHLSCAWKNTPPPRVGNLTGGGLGNPDTTCRYFHHYSFITPQYKTEHDPIHSFVLPTWQNENLSLPGAHNNANVSGLWSCFGTDGSVQDDKYVLRLSESHQSTMFNWTLTCIDGGPGGASDNPGWSTCNAFGTEGGRWHTANGTLNVSSGHMTAIYDNGQRASGSFNSNFSMVHWTDRSVWYRKNEGEFDLCCAACLNASSSTRNMSCRAWTINYDKTNGAATCNLASTTATPYPDESAISGYPIKDDSASYCEQLWASGHDQVWMDEDMSQGVDCASLPADAQDKNPGDFPRAWNDGSGGRKSHRGEAWFFFPYDHIKRQKDDISGEWTSGNAAEDRFMITAQGSPGRFELLCITGGGNADCDPTNKGKKGGAWHAATMVLRQDGFVSIEYDNTVQTNGTFNPTFFRVTWHDGSSWRRVGRCGCSCHPRSDTGCNKMVCSGGALSDQWERQIIMDKPWIVYVHGGDFRYYNNINGGYGFLSSHVAKAAGMGVLAVDYRSASQYPDGIRDIVQACQWLTAKGASEIFLYGDSSGGTIVAETLLWIAHHRLANNSLNISISGAATFSAWLDFTASSPTYESIRWCDGSCYGTGDPVEVEPPGWARMSAFCDAKHYTGPNMPYNMPIVNPMSSPPYLLAELPPIMLVIGSRDILLGDNLMFAQAAQAAGAAVQVEVFEGMWHDFEEESQGCGARGHLTEGLTAVQRVGEFFAAGGSSCKVVCEKGERCSGTAPVNWHYHVNRLPVVPASSC